MEVGNEIRRHIRNSDISGCGTSNIPPFIRKLEKRRQLSVSTFDHLLAADRPVVIDGGLATQLESQGCDLNNPLWSASLLISEPEQIVAAHRAYLDAGAQIIISASYQAIEEQLIAAATSLALRARDEFVAENPTALVPLVAASVGPYGAVRSDGSEYTGNYDKSRDELLEFHRARIAQLDASQVDVLACETIPSMDEASALSELLGDVSTPAWVSFSCRDGESISDGTPIESAAGIFAEHPAVRAVGVNCTSPQYILSLIDRIKRAAPNMPVLVYPNSGELFNADNKTWSGTTSAADWERVAQQWSAAGAKIIGGCCRTGPEHIAALGRGSS